MATKQEVVQVLNSVVGEFATIRSVAPLVSDFSESIYYVTSHVNEPVAYRTILAHVNSKVTEYNKHSDGKYKASCDFYTAQNKEVYIAFVLTEIVK